MLRPEWDAYRVLNELVTALFDWNWQAALPSAVDVSGARRDVGWTARDRLMLEHAWGVGPEAVQRRTGPRVLRGDRGADGAVGLHCCGGGASVDPQRANLSERFHETWPALVALALVTPVYSRRRDLATILAIAACFALYGLSVQTGFKSLPFRLVGPIMTAFICIGVTTLEIRPVGRKMASAVLIGVVLLCGYQARIVFAAMQANHRHSLQVDGEGAALAALQPSLVVIHRDTFPQAHWQQPFYRPASRLVAIRLGRNNQTQLLASLRDSGLSTFPSAMCAGGR